MSNMHPAYGGWDGIPHHGRETAIYQELVKVRQAFDKWIVTFKKEYPGEDFASDADSVENLFERMEADLNQPL